MCLDSGMYSYTVCVHVNNSNKLIGNIMSLEDGSCSTAVTTSVEKYHVLKAGDMASDIEHKVENPMLNKFPIVLGPYFAR